MSTDSRFSHKIWQEEELSKMVDGGVPFPMLSDAGGKVGTIYGVYDEDSGVDIRGRFIIDPDFVIRAMEVMTPEVGRNVSELIRQVKAFQQSGNREVTPSGWQPGKATLKPGPRPAVFGSSGNRIRHFSIRLVKSGFGSERTWMG